MARSAAKWLVALCTLATVAGMVLATGGCGNGGADAGRGTLAVYLADAPDPTVTAVHITLERVEVNVNGEWVTLNTPRQTVNLLDLVTEAMPLGSVTLPPGHCEQVRLFVSQCTVTDALGTHPVTIPSGEQTGIKIPVECDVPANQITGLLLDFNVAQSLHQTGNGEWMLRPVIPAVVQILSGTVTGRVVNSQNNPVRGATVTVLNLLGEAVNSTMTLSDGGFKVWALRPGTYRIRVMHGSKTAIKDGVNVLANRDTDVGTIRLP